MRALIDDLGLARLTPFYRDWVFLGGAAAGLVFWLFLKLIFPSRHSEAAPVGIWLSLVFWQPALEELLFRGALQGHLLSLTWGRRAIGGLTLANLATSLLFAGVHFLHHPPLWAAGVFLPSLLFGLLRERHQSVYPPMALHIYYNIGYFMLTGIAT
jgi:uncharacterized protein